MALEVFNRYEVKYLLTTEQFQKLLKIVPDYMNSDPYNKDGKTYSICNLYLDTENDDLICTSLEKPVYKEKLRLRSYGKTPLNGCVFLEIKKKYKGLVNKRRTFMTLEEAYSYLFDGVVPDNPKMNRQVMEEIKYAQSLYHAVPKAFISYDRFAFFEKEDDDFRLTVDTNIQTRRSDLRLDSDIYGEQLLEEGMWLMEAKASKTFPLWFSHFLSENGIYSCSFSKYGTEYKRFVLNRKK